MGYSDSEEKHRSLKFSEFLKRHFRSSDVQMTINVPLYTSAGITLFNVIIIITLHAFSHASYLLFSKFLYSDGSNEHFQSNGDMDDIDPGDDMTFGAEDEDNAKRKIKVHTCHVCQAQFARANHLTRHMTLHRSVLTHKCDRCDQVSILTL